MIIHLSRLLSIALLALVTTQAKAEEPLPSQVRSSVVMLTAPNGACGSGVLLGDGRILTNAHVATTLCPTFQCEHISVEYSVAVGEPAQKQIPHESLRIERDIAVFDLSVLRLSPAPSTSTAPIFATQPPQPGDEVFLVGFPSCEILRVSRGSIKEVGLIHLQTDAKGTYGSSGSPIFNKNFELVGLADESRSLIPALIALSVGRDFELRGANLASLKPLFETPALNLIDQELTLLLSYYIAEVMPRQDFERYRLGLGFLTMVEELKADLAQQSAPTNYTLPFLTTNTHVQKFLSLPFANLSQESSLVALAKIREDDGFLREGFQTVSMEEIRRVLKPHLSLTNQAYLEKLLTPPHPIGLTYRLLLLGLTATALLLFIAILWALSLSQVFYRSQGSRFSRLIKALAIGVFFWPLSWIIWLWRGSKSSPTSLSFLMLALLLTLTACDPSGGVPPGRIKFKNDLGGEKYSTIRLSGGGRSYVLKSKESIIFPPGTTSISISYQGELEYREYRVECPRNSASGTTMNLIDVYTNRIGGGCKMVWSNR